MSDDQTITLRLSRRDVGRLLVGVQERRRKTQRGLDKFGAEFDPVLGANILEGYKAYTKLQQVLTEAMDENHDHTRRSGRDQEERQARNERSRDHRSPRFEGRQAPRGRTPRA